MSAIQMACRVGEQGKELLADSAQGRQGSLPQEVALE